MGRGVGDLVSDVGEEDGSGDVLVSRWAVSEEAWTLVGRK